MKVAISRVFGRGEFLAQSPAIVARGLERTTYLPLAKADFVDQTAVNAYVVARGGVAADWVTLDLTAVGVI